MSEKGEEIKVINLDSESEEDGEDHDKTIEDIEYAEKNLGTHICKQTDDANNNVAVVKDVVEDDPNFAVICALLGCFGAELKIRYSIPQLKAMFEEYDEEASPNHLQAIHLKLLRTWRRANGVARVFTKKWQQLLADFCNSHAAPSAAQKLAGELGKGYQKTSLSSRLLAFARLLESMLVYCDEVKAKYERLGDARRHSALKPLGRDLSGAYYWLQVDPELHFRLYREERKQLEDGEEIRVSWTMISKSLIELSDCHDQLQAKHCKADYVKLLQLKNFDPASGCAMADEPQKTEYVELTDETVTNENSESSEETAHSFESSEKTKVEDKVDAEVDEELVEVAEATGKNVVSKPMRRSWLAAFQKRQEEVMAVTALKKAEKEVQKEVLLFEQEPDEWFACDEEIVEVDGEKEVKIEVRRARTAADLATGVEKFCEGCGKSDLPHLMLLCDQCEGAFHAHRCLLAGPLYFRPAADAWFCPLCEHSKLIDRLQHKLFRLMDDIAVKAVRDEKNEKKQEFARRKRAEAKKAADRKEAERLAKMPRLIVTRSMSMKMAKNEGT